MHAGLRIFVFGALAALSLILPVAAAERAIIVLDGSGSMWAQIDGKARITIARETLASVLATLPDDLELGLMTYGHREKGNCKDIEMLVEPAVGNGAAIAAAADGINPKGMTPISDAVRLAAEDLRYTEQKATVILITDGLETCHVDPCALAADLENKGVDFTTHVLGFGLSDEEGQQVKCLAENTGGQYLSAKDADGLVKALTETVAAVTQAEPEPVPEPAPAPAALDYTVAPTASLTEGGPELIDDMADLVWSFHAVAADGSAGDWIRTEYHSGAKIDMEPGDYIMRAEWGAARIDQPVTVKAGEVITPNFVLNAGTIKVRPHAAEGAPIDDGATVNLAYPGDSTTNYGESIFRVPAGEQTLTVQIGSGTAVESFTLAAGQTIEKDVIVGVGRAKLDAAYVEGMPVQADIYIEVLEAKKAIDGSRKQMAYGYGGEQSFDLPPGDYVASYTLGGARGEVPFAVKTAELSEVPLLLNAGILAVTSPGDDSIEVFDAAKSIEGNRKKVDYGFGPAYQTTLPAGDYVVVTSRDSDSSETPITIKPGERLELAVAPQASPTK